MKPRIKPKKLAVEERVKSFNEVVLGYTEEEAIKEAERCIQCPTPPCVTGCPISIDIPSFIKALRERRFEDSYKIMIATNPFPSICGRICPQEQQCEKVCTLGKIGEPVAIGKLEKFIGDLYLNKSKPEVTSPNGKKVAVVGSGPAGLACAYTLAKMGYSVSIFESLHKPGGVLTYGIPAFRLPKNIVEGYVNQLREMGVKIEVDVLVGRTIKFEYLLRNFDAVFLGTGAGLPRFLNIPGENLNGIYSANEFLTRVNLMKAYLFPEYETPIYRAKHTVVIGGGNVAMDAARVALRLGSEVTIAYRRSRKEMPARIEEIENAEEEGVKFVFLSSPIRFISRDNFWVSGVEFIRNRLGPKGPDGRRSFVPVEGSNYFMKTDCVVIAIGQLPNPLLPRLIPKLECDERKGTIKVDEEGRTSIPKVYAGGDITTGAATAVEAIAAGVRVAYTIHKDLS